MGRRRLLLTNGSVLLFNSVVDAKAFLAKYPDEAAAVCERAGTKVVYLKQLASGFRRPSPEMAQRLALASSGRMDVLSLLFPKQRAA